MLNRIIAGLILLLGGMSSVAASADYGGNWIGDDGATYYVRHIGDEIYWFNEGGAEEPRRTSIFSGRVRGQMILGSWIDVPKGAASGRGELHLTIRQDGNVFEVTRVTGGFTATRITRAGFVPPPPLVLPEEKCVDFEHDQLAVRQLEGSYQIVQDDLWLFDFGARESNAHAALKIIQQYGMNQSCSIGEPPALRFLLVSGRAPLGQSFDEDCVRFLPSTLVLVQRDGRWLLVDKDLTLYDFGSREVEAQAALAAILKYQFTHVCYVGRPSATFEYFRR